MPPHLIIGIGSGLVSAALFASAAAGSPIAAMLFYLAPLPLYLAGLGWGGAAALMSALSGTIIVVVTLGPVTAAAFAVSIAAPAALLTYLALLSRTAKTPEGQGSAVIEWYPPGRIVGWAALIAGLLAALLMLLLGYDQDSYRESIREILNQSSLKELDPDGTLFTEENIANFSRILARAFPGLFAIFWLATTLFNLWLAGVIVDASGRALRPRPDLHALELPNALLLIFAAALAVSLLPGLPGLLATGLAGALFLAYTLQGLAVIHVYSRGMALRGLLLATVYLGILLLGWVALIVAVIGLAEPALGLRRRAAQGGGPKGGGTV